MRVVPFRFTRRAPKVVPSALVESIWHARGTVTYSRERITPTGSTVAVVVLADPIVQTPIDDDSARFRAEHGFIVGPHDRPAINEPTGETHAVGIVTRPVGCEAIFGIRPSRLRGRVVDLAGVWAPADQLRQTLLDGRLSATGMLDAVEAVLMASTGPVPDAVDRCEEAVAMLEADPARPISQVAATLGLSHGHLDREFTRIVGMSPRSLARIIRMRQLLTELDVGRPIDWAELATGGGWYDQAHLIRDFKHYTGSTPSRYVSAQLDVFSADQLAGAAGFVPER